MQVRKIASTNYAGIQVLDFHLAELWEKKFLSLCFPVSGISLWQLKVPNTDSISEDIAKWKNWKEALQQSLRNIRIVNMLICLYLSFFTSPIMSEHVFCFLFLDQVLKILISLYTNLCVLRISTLISLFQLCFVNHGWFFIMCKLTFIDVNHSAMQFYQSPNCGRIF